MQGPAQTSKALDTVILLVSIVHYYKNHSAFSHHTSPIFGASSACPPAIFSLAIARGSVFAATRSTVAQVAGFNLAKEASSEDFCLLLNLREIKHVDK